MTDTLLHHPNPDTEHLPPPPALHRAHPWWLDTALLLAAASGSLYLIAWAFWDGYAAQFGVPHSLLETSPAQTIASGWRGLAWALLVACLLALFVRSLSRLSARSLPEPPRDRVPLGIPIATLALGITLAIIDALQDQALARGHGGPNLATGAASLAIGLACAGLVVFTAFRHWTTHSNWYARSPWCFAILAPLVCTSFLLSRSLGRGYAGDAIREPRTLARPTWTGRSALPFEAAVLGRAEDKWIFYGTAPGEQQPSVFVVRDELLEKVQLVRNTRGKAWLNPPNPGLPATSPNSTRSAAEPTLSVER